MIPVGHRHTNKAGNIYTSEDYDDVRVSWIDFEKLEITCVGVGEDFIMEENFQGIQIVYKLIKSEPVAGGDAAR